MHNPIEPSVTTGPAGHASFPCSLDAEFFGEPLDPNEIRIALDELRDLMSRIRSAAIRRDVKAAYDRIASIMVLERSPANQNGPMPRSS